MSDTLKFSRQNCTLHIILFDRFQTLKKRRETVLKTIQNRREFNGNN